jgi:hypothetical protein
MSNRLICLAFAANPRHNSFARIWGTAQLRCSSPQVIA